jgi:Ca2+-binding RTX toxin-like protein
LTGNGIKNYLEGMGGADRLDGGDGFDYAWYRSSSIGVTVNLNYAGAQASAGDAAGDVLINIEGVDGSQGDDRLIGNSAANGLYGNGGTDTLTGGAGSDIFGFNTTGGVGDIDIITDFKVGKLSDDGDILHVGNIIPDFGAGDDINDWLRIAFSGGQTILQVDTDGEAGGATFTDLAVLVGVSSGISIDTLVNNGQIDTVPVTD